MCKMSRARFLLFNKSSSYLYDRYKSFDAFFNDYFQNRIEKCIHDNFKEFTNGNYNAFSFESYNMVLEYLLNKTNYSIDLDNAMDVYEFKSTIQYVIDNHLIEEVISYMEDITYRFLYESFEKCFNSKTVFKLSSSDSYYENGLLGVVKVDFKNLNVVIFDGMSVFDKIILSKNSPKVCVNTIDYYMRKSSFIHMGEIVTNSIYINKEPSSNNYVGKVTTRGLLSCGHFQLYASWRGVSY